MNIHTHITAEEMLQQQETLRLCWVDPWPGMTADGRPLDIAVKHSATVRECIQMQRAARAKQTGTLEGVLDLDLLLDFMAVNWASVAGCVMVKPEQTVWVIPCPASLAPVQCASFEEAMTKWFEGYNIPVLVTDGVAEPFEESCRRVTEYFDRHSPRSCCGRSEKECDCDPKLEGQVR